jgi:environmental stress-induced protein Ves
MSNVHRFQRADLTAQPWKNGGGVTKEIVSWPPGSTVANFNWRVSIAHIASSGPFSAFPGVDRVITLLEGAGVALHAANGNVTHRLEQALVPFSFAGEAPIQADLLGPDCHDFNVMTRRSTCSATVQVVNKRVGLPMQSQGLLFAPHGQWRANDETLLANEGLWWHDEPFAWTLTPLDANAALIAVLIQPHP